MWSGDLYTDFWVVLYRFLGRTARCLGRTHRSLGHLYWTVFEYLMYKYMYFSETLTQPLENDGWKTTLFWDGNCSWAMSSFGLDLGCPVSWKKVAQPLPRYRKKMKIKRQVPAPSTGRSTYVVPCSIQTYLVKITTPTWISLEKILRIDSTYGVTLCDEPLQFG